MEPKIFKKDLEVLRAQLENERATFLTHWRDLGDYILPRRPRFTVTDTNKGDRRNQKIIDATATLAARTLRSGLMSGVTSPARPWFRLTTPDPKLREIASVKAWLDDVERAMYAVFLKSNLYNALPTVYGDMGIFATAAVHIEEDIEHVIRAYPYPIGSYMIANDDRLKVNVFFRDFRMTVRQLVDKFGYDDGPEIDWTKFSLSVKQLYDKGMHDAWVDVCHVIKPNPLFDKNKLHAKYKKFMSYYYERGQQGSSGITFGPNDDQFLRASGYDHFPVLCPRWETTGEDAYGTECPGMQSLGDIKALQLMQKRKSQAVEKMVNPPMTGPVSLKNQRSSIIAGDITYVDSRDQQSGFRPVHEVNPRVQELLADIQDTQNRVRRAMYEDLFLLLSQDDRSGITAREVDERHEEKLLALGPVLEQLNQDLLDPLIDITFDIMVKQGRIPTPPEELKGQPLRIEYVSVMAQAQKLVGISNIERFLGVAGQIIKFNPESSDKIDFDQALDIYGDTLSIQTGIIRPDDQVADRRQARAAQQQAQQQAEQAAMAAKSARDLSQTDLSSNNALKQVVDQTQQQAGAPGRAGAQA